LEEAGARPSGVRRIETSAPGRARELEATLALAHTKAGCFAALRAAAVLYRGWRGDPQRTGFVTRATAEAAAMAYLDEVEGSQR
jgi:hypothetical protein